MGVHNMGKVLQFQLDPLHIVFCCPVTSPCGTVHPFFRLILKVQLEQLFALIYSILFLFLHLLLSSYLSSSSLMQRPLQRSPPLHLVNPILPLVSALPLERTPPCHCSILSSHPDCCSTFTPSNS